MVQAPEQSNFLCTLLTIATLGILRFFSVSQGSVRVVTALGKFVRVVDPGLGKCLSFWGLYQHPGPVVPAKEQVRDYSRQEVFTRDGVACRIDAVVFYRINDVMKALYEVEDYELALENLVKANLRNECGNLPARELLAAREKLADRLRQTLDEDTSPWGITVRLAEIKGIEMMKSPQGGAPIA